MFIATIAAGAAFAAIPTDPTVVDAPLADDADVAVADNGFFTRGASVLKGGCGQVRITHPYLTEYGDYVATRMDPPSAPFAVDEVRYYLFDGLIQSTGQTCDVSVAHDVVLFKGDASLPPPATPTELLRTSVSPGASTASGVAEFVVPVSGVMLMPGESLWVSVEMQGADPAVYDDFTCPVLCPDDPERAIEDGYWSDSAAAPYPWKELEYYDIYSDPVVVMGGRMPAFP